MDLHLKGKKALVTGSSIGIGEATAKTLASEGAEVMVHGRQEKELQRVVKEITEAGGKAHYVRGDLTSDSAARFVVDRTLETFGGLDILVNNAGAFPAVNWTESSPQAWLDLFNTNVVSTVRMIQGFLPQMKSRGWGRIIMIASVASTKPTLRAPAYASTKAALLNMTISLAKELKETGITVNAVSPGPILTPGAIDILLQIAADKGWGDNMDEIEKKAVAEAYPLLVGRFGRSEEVANIVTYLASPLADFIHGSNYHVDGGRQG